MSTYMLQKGRYRERGTKKVADHRKEKVNVRLHRSLLVIVRTAGLGDWQFLAILLAGGPDLGDLFMKFCWADRERLGVFLFFFFPFLGGGYPRIKL